jgi:hypothetical protein
VYEGQQLRLRRLPQGTAQGAIVQAVEGRVMVLDLVQRDLLTDSADFLAGAPVEMDGEDALFLGMIEHREGERVRVRVEHMLERQALSRIQALWKEAAH